MSEKERAKVRGTRVAYVPQSAAAAFNPSQRIMDQVVEVARIHDLMPMAEARRKAVDLFRALALPGPETIGQRYPHQVSGGQLQRLAAAMALIGDPEVMIFDEPTTALDVTTQIEVLRAFKSVMRARGMAGVYVSHDLAVVAQIADRIMVLKNGETQEVGTTEEIVTNPRHEYTKALIAAAHPAASQSRGQRERAGRADPRSGARDGGLRARRQRRPSSDGRAQGRLAEAAARAQSRRHRRIGQRKVDARAHHGRSAAASFGSASGCTAWSFPRRRATAPRSSFARCRSSSSWRTLRSIRTGR